MTQPDADAAIYCEHCGSRSMRPGSDRVCTSWPYCAAPEIPFALARRILAVLDLVVNPADFRSLAAELRERMPE